MLSVPSRWLSAAGDFVLSIGRPFILALPPLRIAAVE
jgi:hypothetical protein